MLLLCCRVQLRLSAFDTPYGDAQLDPVGIPKDVRQKLVWEELEHRMKRGEPVKVRLCCSMNWALCAWAGLDMVALLLFAHRPLAVLEAIK